MELDGRKLSIEWSVPASALRPHRKPSATPYRSSSSSSHRHESTPGAPMYGGYYLPPPMYPPSFDPYAYGHYYYPPPPLPHAMAPYGALMYPHMMPPHYHYEKGGRLKERGQRRHNPY